MVVEHQLVTTMMRLETTLTEYANHLEAQAYIKSLVTGFVKRAKPANQEAIALP